METALNGILNQMDPITLDCMDAVKLMKRTDEKYVCSISRLPALLEAAKGSFRVLEHFGRRMARYESLYLDTPGHDLYLMHHNGRLNRWKVRIREYCDSGEAFFEVKLKDNRKITSKMRIPIGREHEYHSEAVARLLETVSPLKPDMLVPSLRSSFNRITLVNCAIGERVTIDTAMRWNTDDRSVCLPGIAILEVKSSRSSSSLGFGYLLREQRIHPLRVSKYCIGVSLLYPELKHNSFKSKIRVLNKINEQDDIALPHAG